MEGSDIQAALRGSRVLITGGFGFLGRVLLEKLLRACDPDMVYLLARPKKGRTEAERLDKMFSDQLFGRLLENNPHARERVSLITGDLELQDLGLSPEDRAVLTRDVHFVFHSGATIRFDETLQVAYRVNIRGTRKLLELAKTMNNLKAFVHISTAYAYCPIKTIDEKVYPAPWNWEELDQLIESVDETTLNWITPIVIGDWPNTYSFSKTIAENVVEEFAADLPVAIVRPSIVCATAKEPVIFWCNNVNSPTGVAMGGALGILKGLHCDPSKRSDMVPVDMVINAILAVAWDLTQSEKKAIEETRDKKIRSTPVYNYVCDQRNPITWADYVAFLESSNPPESVHVVWNYCFKLIKNKVIYNFYVVLLHYLQAILLDTGARIVGRKPMLWNAYKKISKYTSVISYFALQEWTFTNCRTRELWKKLSRRDQDLFWFDMAQLDWSMYIYFLLRGTRIYIVHESFDTEPLGKKKCFRLKILHYTIAYSFYTAVAYWTYKVFHPYVLAFGEGLGIA